jgi:hypothetical protein
MVAIDVIPAVPSADPLAKVEKPARLEPRRVAVEPVFVFLVTAFAALVIGSLLALQRGLDVGVSFVAELLGALVTASPNSVTQVTHRTHFSLCAPCARALPYNQKMRHSVTYASPASSLPGR